MHKNRRGNPNWGKQGTVPEVVPDSDWDALRKRLGLTETEAIKSPVMKAWAKTHQHKKYVPTDARVAWGWISIYE